jgi:transposase-like protein
MEKSSEKKIRGCPGCGKSYGINVRVDDSFRCRLCGYDSKKEVK